MTANQNDSYPLEGKSIQRKNCFYDDQFQRVMEKGLMDPALERGSNKQVFQLIIQWKIRPLVFFDSPKNINWNFLTISHCLFVSNERPTQDEIDRIRKHFIKRKSAVFLRQKYNFCVDGISKEVSLSPVDIDDVTDVDIDDDDDTDDFVNRSSSQPC